MKIDRVFQTKRLKVFEVAENVFAAITPNKGFGWANAGFIARGKGLVYDTFYDLPHCHEMLDVYKQVTGESRPGFVVNSHYNADHIFGNRLFRDSTIIMHKKALEERLHEPISMFRDFMKHGADPDASAFDRFMRDESHGILATLDFRGVEWVEPDILVESSVEIRLEGLVAQALCVAPAHSESDLLLWLPEERVVFCGDVVFSGGGIVAYSEKGMRLWSAALDKIIELNPKVVVPGHGALCGADHVKEIKRYFTDVLDGFEKYYDPDITPLELAKKIDVGDYVNWLQPERLYTIINALCNGRRGLPQVPDWGDAIPKMEELSEYHNKKYKNIKEPWDPMSSWLIK
jgi:glyoxylase-like metal-dependent hydrolase (beta-lactamase superfamily II)